MIDRATIERIKDSADIVDVVSEFVSLKKVGANYRGLCPFHNDHTPSFYVSPSRRTCHCFVCGEGGDAVGFVMKHEQMTYPDALRWLARRYHIDIQERELTDEQRKEQSEREAMFIVNEWATDYFKDILHNDIDGRAIGMQYFRQRGIRDDIIEKFRLGFCLSDRQAMADAALKKGYKGEYLVKTGLCFPKTQGVQGEALNTPGALVDRFAGRAIFPWIGVSGKVVAFGGRVLDSRTKGVNQKYVNSPDSEIYHKDHELYGIFQAKKAIAKENCVYMVEGYTDVISMHQCGIENVVANSGTALSEHQIHILHRFTPNIVLLYDGDEAGIKAALRSSDMLLKEGMNVKVLLLPDGDDPDSFAKKHSEAEFRKYIEEHQTDIIEFMIRVQLDGVTDPVKRSEAISSIIQSISMIGDPITRAAYIQSCTARLGINEQTLTSKMNEYIRGYRDEQRKEEARKQRQEQGNGGAVVPSQPSSRVDAPNDEGLAPPPMDFPPPPEALGLETVTSNQPVLPAERNTVRKIESVSDLLLKMVIKHGNELLFQDVETDDGSTISLTLAQYVVMDLAEDGLRFSLPIYNKVLEEAVHLSEEYLSGDKAEAVDTEKYFCLHPDYDVSSLAIRLTSDKVLLSKSMEVKHTEGTLRDMVRHLLLDFRQEYISAKLKQLQTDIMLAADNPERQMELMAELQDTQKIRNAIAKKIGNSLVPK